MLDRIRLALLGFAIWTKVFRRSAFEGLLAIDSPQASTMLLHHLTEAGDSPAIRKAFLRAIETSNNHAAARSGERDLVPIALDRHIAFMLSVFLTDARAHSKQERRAARMFLGAANVYNVCNAISLLYLQEDLSEPMRQHRLALLNEVNPGWRQYTRLKERMLKHHLDKAHQALPSANAGVEVKDADAALAKATKELLLAQEVYPDWPSHTSMKFSLWKRLFTLAALNLSDPKVALKVLDIGRLAGLGEKSNTLGDERDLVRSCVIEIVARRQKGKEIADILLAMQRVGVRDSVPILLLELLREACRNHPEDEVYLAGIMSALTEVAPGWERDESFEYQRWSLAQDFHAHPDRMSPLVASAVLPHLGAELAKEISKACEPLQRHNNAQCPMYTETGADYYETEKDWLSWQESRVDRSKLSECQEAASRLRVYLGPGFRVSIPDSSLVQIISLPSVVTILVQVKRVLLEAGESGWVKEVVNLVPLRDIASEELNRRTRC